MLYFTSISTGIIFGIGAVGLGLIYKYLKFPDFTTVASLSIGSAVMAVVSTYNIPLAIVLSILAGGFLGLITYIQIRYFDVNEILAGIISGIGALSLIYLVTTNQAIVNCPQAEKDIFDCIISSKFSWWNIIKVGLIGLTLSYLISRIFDTKYGLYILGLLGTLNYINHRHRNKNKAILFLLVLGNGLISFAGSILTIQNGSSNVSGTPDFLVTALSGYILASFIIKSLSGEKSSSHFQKESKPSGKYYFKLLHLLQVPLNKNDEEPVKIFWFFNFVIVGTVLVNLIFQYIDTTLSDDNRLSYLYKALIFLGVIAIGKIERIVSNN